MPKTSCTLNQLVQMLNGVSIQQVMKEERKKKQAPKKPTARPGRPKNPKPHPLQKALRKKKINPRVQAATSNENNLQDLMCALSLSAAPKPTKTIFKQKRKQKFKPTLKPRPRPKPRPKPRPAPNPHFVQTVNSPCCESPNMVNAHPEFIAPYGVSSMCQACGACK